MLLYILTVTDALELGYDFGQVLVRSDRHGARIGILWAFVSVARDSV